MTSEKLYFYLLSSNRIMDFDMLQFLKISRINTYTLYVISCDFLQYC